MLPGITDQRIDIDVLDGLTVGFVLSVHATAPGGRPEVGPVGGPIAGSAKAICVHQRLQQRTMAISSLPVVRHLPGAEGQDLARQPFDSYPRQNQEASVVDDPLQVALPLLVTPADPKVPGLHLPGGRGPQETS